jgi:hypothetical protein
MFTNQDLLERIEDAERVNPFCQLCGQPTTVTERDRALWLECSELRRDRGRLSSLFRLASLHTRRPIVELCAA